MIKINGRDCNGVLFANGRPRKGDKAYLIRVAIANAWNPSVIVQAFSPGEAIDELVDSRYGHLIILDDEEYASEREELGCAYYAGNEGVPVDLDNVYIEEIKTIDYFGHE